MRTTIAAILLSVSATACGGASTTPPAAPAGAQAAAKKAPGEARVGDTTTCPVSGEEFVVAADSPKAEHEGKTYYFCCSGCAKKFQADPRKFVAKPQGS